MRGRTLVLLLLAAALSFQAAADQPPQWPQQLLDKVDAALGQYQRQAAKEWRGVVVSVHDGDSLRVRDAHGRVHRLRLAFVDAPEIGQAHGLASRNGLRARLLERPVTVTVLARDRYRREVAQIWLNGADISLWQLQQGAAWHYRSIAKQQQSAAAYARYSAAEFNARRSGQGLWGQSDAVPPWQFRRTLKYSGINN